MKTKKATIFTILLAFSAFGISGFTQTINMRIMKNGTETNLTIVPLSGDNIIVAFDEIDKLLLRDLLSGINLPKAQSDIVVYLTAEGDAVVESKVAIQSLTVINMTGAVVTREQFPNSKETFRQINMQSFPAGVYIVCVKTLEGTTAKKLIIKN